mmetsp:Transcript_29150/g.74942  ORF Transcript_29150/g.74942 Transcript_29150/m.74942 type:complete len:211 (+) Transcript_29150:1496-2128(+)
MIRPSLPFVLFRSLPFCFLFFFFFVQNRFGDHSSVVGTRFHKMYFAVVPFPYGFFQDHMLAQFFHGPNGDSQRTGEIRRRCVRLFFSFFLVRSHFSSCFGVSFPFSFSLLLLLSLQVTCTEGVTGFPYEHPFGHGTRRTNLLRSPTSHRTHRGESRREKKDKRRNTKSKVSRKRKRHLKGTYNSLITQVAETRLKRTKTSDQRRRKTWRS